MYCNNICSSFQGSCITGTCKLMFLSVVFQLVLSSAPSLFEISELHKTYASMFIISIYSIYFNKQNTVIINGGSVKLNEETD